MTSPSRVEEITSVLAGVVGEESAGELLRAVANELEIDPDAPGEEGADRILERVGLRSGALGAAARLLLRRTREQRGKRPSRPPPPRASVHPPAPPNVHANRRRLVEMLAMSLGWEKAESCIEQAASAHKIPEGRFTRADALIVLDDLTTQPGLIGTVARFAKARVHMEFEK